MRHRAYGQPRNNAGLISLKMGRQPSAKRARASKEGMGTMMHTPDASAPRDKPAITTGLRKGARQRRSGAAHDAQEQESALPPELLQLIGGAVDGPDLAAASLVCKLWSRSLRGGEAPGAQRHVGSSRCRAQRAPDTAGAPAVVVRGPRPRPRTHPSPSSAAWSQARSVCF